MLFGERKNLSKKALQIIKVTSILILFFSTVAASVIALWLYNTKGDFVSAVKSDVFLAPKLFVWTVAIMFLSSVLYTPLSFGISNCFISKDESKIKSLLFMFTRPRLLFKAIVMNAVKKLCIYLARLAVLVAALVMECVIFIVSVILSGENIFIYERDFLQNVLEFMTTDKFFISLTVLQWTLVLFALLYINIRYILCKYVMLSRPSVTVFEAVSIGLFATRGKFFQIVRFYLRFAAIFLLKIVTLGRIKYKLSFSQYAFRLAQDGFMLKMTRRY